MDASTDRPSLSRRRHSIVSRIAVCAVAAALLTGGLPLRAQAVGVIIQVNTTSDAEDPGGGLCSFRGAILASNGGNFGGCAGTAEVDSIRFALGGGTPVITIGSPLPTISQQVTIAGNTGGATRVRLDGPGAGIGLTVNAAGTTFRNLVIDGFGTGIEILSSNVTVTGSVIGPNSIGIDTRDTGTVIGGTTGVTPGGPCTGVCNQIIGNGISGLLLLDGSGTVQGNFIGTANGTLPSGNGVGIWIDSGSWTIGGSVAGAGNVIGGNANVGIGLFGCSNCSILGNTIGATADGAAALGNAASGILVDGVANLVIGGAGAGAGNLISANADNGIWLGQAFETTILGNRIGTTASGQPLGNGGDGIRGDGQDMSNSHIGSLADPAGANVIAHNAGAGIRIIEAEGTSFDENEIRRNSIYANGGPGIVLENGANDGIAAPTVTGLRPVRGTACATCAVDVYSDSQDEGRVYEGTVVANGIGQWTYPGVFAGPRVTATATDGVQNTSAFSLPLIPTTPFTDIANSSFKANITWLYANGITTGCSATTYCPGGSVTREQMASFLVRMFQLPATATDFFTDDETSSHEANINRLAAAGITTGCTATTFCPSGPVTREQMASFITRAAELTVGAGRNYFNDDDSSTHEPNIDRIAAAGITTGCATWTYCPGGTVTREQMAAFLHRILVPAVSPPYPAAD